MNSDHQNEGSKRVPRPMCVATRCGAPSFCCLAGWIALWLLSPGNAAAQQTPDMIYYNGNIVTVWADHPSVDAVAMVVIDKDFLHCPVDEIKEIEPLETIVGGKAVYTRPGKAGGAGS